MLVFCKFHNSNVKARWAGQGLVILRVPQLQKPSANQNARIVESGIPLQKAFTVDDVQCIFHWIYQQNVYTSSIQHQFVNMMSSVNKYKISLEPAKHITERVRKLLQARARESNIETELGVLKSKALESSSAEIIQSPTIISFCTTKETDQITITGFCTNITRAVLETNQIKVILHSTRWFSYYCQWSNWMDSVNKFQ